MMANFNKKIKNKQKGSLMLTINRISIFIAIFATQNIADAMSFKIIFSSVNDPQKPVEKKMNAIDTHLKRNGTFYVGMYNGYGRINATDYLVKNLAKNIFGDDNFELDTERALYDSYIKTHFNYKDDDEHRGTMDGVAAASILIKDSKIYASNSGDVQSVLFEQEGQLTMLSQLHSVSQEFDRIEDLMRDSHDELVSSSPREIIPKKKHSSKINSPYLKHYSGISTPRSSTSSPRLLQEVAASPRGSTSILRQTVPLEKIASNIHLKDIEVERLSEYDSEKVSIQTIYLAKKRHDSAVQDFTSLSRGLCNHLFAPYLIPDPFIKTINLTSKISFIIMATKRFWLAIKPELAGKMVCNYLDIAQDIESSRSILLDEELLIDEKEFKNECKNGITQHVANLVVKMLWRQAFPQNTQSSNSLAIIFFDHKT